MADENELERNVLYDLHISAAEKSLEINESMVLGMLDVVVNKLAKRCQSKNQGFMETGTPKKLGQNIKEVPISHKK